MGTPESPPAAAEPWQQHWKSAQHCERPFVCICGLPGAGNRLVQAHLWRCGLGTPSAPLGDVHIYHGDRTKGPDHVMPWSMRKAIEARPECKLHVVIPVRHPVERRRTSSFARMPWSEGEEASYHLWIAGFVQEFAARVKHLSFEALIADPQAVADDLSDWLGVPRCPWPTEVDEQSPWMGAVR